MVASSLFVAEWAKAIAVNASRTDAFVSLVANPDFPQYNIVAKIAGRDPTASRRRTPAGAPFSVLSSD